MKEARAALSATPLGVVLVVLTFIAVLHYGYVERVAPDFAYLGYTTRTDLNPLTYATATALAIAVALLIPRRIDRPSVLMVWVIYMVAVLPGLIVPQLHPALAPEDALWSALALATAFAIIAILGTRRTLRGFMPKMTVTPTTFGIILALVSACTYSYLALTTGLPTSLPAFGEVYDVRADFKVAISGTYLGYVIPLQANVINPAFIVRGLYSNRWGWIVLGFLGQAVIYGAIAQKAILLSTPVLIVVAFLFRARSRPPGILLILGVTLVAAAALAADGINKSRWLTSLFVRRFIITPGLLYGAYVGVWQDIPKALWRHSSITFSLWDYPYPYTPPYMVGSRFFGSAEMSANANVFADGYANFGYLGVFISAAVVTVVLWAIDDVSQGLPVAVAGIIFLVPSLELSGSSIFTVLLTHGLGAAILLAALMPREGWWQRPTPRPEPTDPRRATAARQ